MAQAVTTEIISKGIDLIGQLLIYGQRRKRNPYAEERADTRSRITQMEAYIDEELAKFKGGQASGYDEAPIAQKSAPARISVQVSESREHKANDNGLDPHNGEGIGMACLPCTRAHLITVRGTLKEALRFALGEKEGVKHQEVVDRLDAAAEELTVMERFDLAPEKIAKTSAKEKAIINQMLPKIRSMRQEMLNGLSSPEELQEMASMVDEIYKQVRTTSGGSSIDWAKVDHEVEDEE